MSTLELVVLGDPRAKERPRAGRNGFYTPKRTTQGEDAVRRAWMVAGGYTLGDGPLTAMVCAYFKRPPSHYLKGGRLSAAGRKAVVPSRLDVDNVAKLHLDALNGHAYKDDSQITSLTAQKWWCVRGEEPRVVVRISSLRTP